MPVYQYACTECGEQLEVRQSFTDDPLTVCPACSGRLRKVLSAVGVVFKGSGFYRTDSRVAEGAAASGSGDGSSSSKEAAKEPAKADSSKAAGDKAAASNGSSGSKPAAATSSPSGSGAAGGSSGAKAAS